VGHCGEHMGGVSRGPLNAVAMINLALSSLDINIKEVQIVVKINVTSAEIPPQEGGVGGEDGGQPQVPLAGQDKPNTDLPLMKVGNHVAFRGLVSKLEGLEGEGEGGDL